MSQCVVPNWNIRKEQDEDEEGKRSAHVQNQHRSLPTPMSNYEVTELRWENGHLAMHGFGGITDLTSLKPMFQTGETLESVVHQATHHKCIPNLSEYDHKRENMNSVVASSGGKWVEDSLGSDPLKKRAKTQSGGLRGKQHSSSFLDVGGVNSTGTTSFQETDTNTTTWASFDSPGSLMKTRTTDEDSACRSGPVITDSHRNQDEERETKTETGRSFSTRRSRAAAVHNQSERRRRDKINQKMKALQKLVPNSSKTDKASMLDEVIDYLKQLQAQIHMMSLGNMPHMMMPLGMQQHLQMSLLARMGMGMGLGMGMGMLDMNTVNRAAAAAAAAQPIPSILHPTAAPARPTPAFVPPPFLIPPLMPAHSTTRANPEPVANHPMSLPDPYSAFLTQSMNVDLYNKMAALYRQQMNQTTHSSAPRHGSNAPHD